MLWIEEKFDYRTNPNMVFLKHDELKTENKMVWSPLEEDFTFSVTNSYSQEQGLLDAGLELARQGQRNVAKVFGNERVGTKSIKSSLQEWQDSGNPSFSVSLIFPSLKPSDDPIGRAKAILDVVSPNTSGDNSIAVLTAPGNYMYYGSGWSRQEENLKLDAEIPGTWTMFIKGICRVPNLICDSCSLIVSKDRVKDGKPLWVKVNMSLMPARQMTSRDYLNWFDNAPKYISGDS